jgi:FkbM family methyltransferase
MLHPKAPVTRYAVGNVDKLVFDIGANTGQDTAALLARGFRVVAVEANPRLCANLRQRFASEIADGRLTLVDKAISRRKTVTLYVNSADSNWGTTLAKYAARGQSVAGAIEQIEVETTTLTEIIREHGSPAYIKIDIEGADILCLLDLIDADIPRFISIERPRELGEQLFAWQLLRRLGYRRFQLVDQRKVAQQRHPALRFQVGDSGLFGEELPKQRWTGIAAALVYSGWIDARAALRPVFRRLPLLSRIDFGGRWFDIHAAKSA